MIIGYTTGVFDLFHIGHLNLLKNAKGLCDRLIVGVTTDELKYKNKRAVIPFDERVEIVRNISFVDAVVPQYQWINLRHGTRSNLILCLLVTIGTILLNGKSLTLNSKIWE